MRHSDQRVGSFSVKSNPNGNSSSFFDTENSSISAGDNTGAANVHRAGGRRLLLHDGHSHRSDHSSGCHGGGLGHWASRLLRLRSVGLSKRRQHRLGTNESWLLHHRPVSHFHPIHWLQFESSKDTRSSHLEWLLD